MKLNRKSMLAVRLIRQGFTFAKAIREQMAQRGLKMRVVPFYQMMARLENRLIVRGRDQPVTVQGYVFRLRCYEYNDRPVRNTR